MTRKQKITVLYNEVSALPYEDNKALLMESGAKDDAVIIATALRQAGYQADTMELSVKSVKNLRHKKADLFFNLCDGIGNLPKTEQKVPEMLDRLKLPYTGANASALVLTTNKALTKQIFEQNGIPTPAYALFESAPIKLPDNLSFPLIVKPVAEDCSLGISSNSVVTNLSDLKKEIKRVVARYHEPALVEKYIRGRELNITVIGNGRDISVLPISEIKFGNSYLYDAKPKVVDFSAKWVENSASYKDTNGICPAHLSEKLRHKIEKMAINAYLLCGARDYARIDIRLSKEQIPYVLEINVNPDLSPDMGASRSAKAIGMDYKDFIKELASAASRRYRISTLN